MDQRVALLAKYHHYFCQIRPCILQDWLPRARSCLLGFICYVNMASCRQRTGTVIFISLDAPLQAIRGVLVTPSTTELPHIQIHNCLVSCKTAVLFKKWNTKLSRISHHLNLEQGSYKRVGTLIVATIYLQLIQNIYMFRSFTVLQCSHQHCVQPVASDMKVVGYL